MILFEYKVSPAWLSPSAPESIFRIIITDDNEDNVITWFHDKKYSHTIPTSEIDKIKDIIKNHPELFNIPKYLEPNTVLDGEAGSNILDYGRSPRKNATLAIRVARTIKEKVLDLNGIRTMIPSRLQHWPKYRKPSNIIKI